MNSRAIPLILLVSMSVSATTPPMHVPFETKVCAATHIFVGTASEFSVVPHRSGVPDRACSTRGNGESLTMCEEVQVKITVSETIVPDKWVPREKLTFRFGGGMFSVADLRNDLVGKPRFFFTTVSLDGAEAVYRTSYDWFLGAEFTPENVKLVNEALGKCVAPNSSFKPTPLRGAA